MDYTNKERIRNTILGALVADEASVGFHGADDEQLSAISKLPPLVAVYAGKDTLHKVVESSCSCNQ